MEIILSKVSPEEKWSRLNMLKKLAYKAQFLDRSALIYRYAGFLRKVEKGQHKWGSEDAPRELDEALRFKTFTSFKKPWSKSNDSGAKPSSSSDGNKSYGKKFYCLDYNKGTCSFGDSHEGRFNRATVWKIHMCRRCWEKDGKEVKHPENHGDCPHSN